MSSRNELKDKKKAIRLCKALLLQLDAVLMIILRLSGRLHLDEVTGLGCGFGEDTVVDGEESQFETVGDA